MPDSSAFPTTRLRRLRYHPAVRELVRETRLSPANLILPLFVRPGKGVQQEIAAMPGNCQLSPDMLADEISQAVELGLGGVILFGIPDTKDATGSDALSDSGIIAQAIRAAKHAARDFLVITDVCFCEYTDHGHCGPVAQTTGRHDVDNDATLELLAQQAVVHARAGADMIAPSGMMDGMVGAIRQALDAAGFPHLPIMSYAAKYASAFYGPFREAAESAPQFGDRRGYQMDPAAAAGPGDARDRTRSGRRGRHRHGQAGLGLSRHHPPGPRPLPRRAAGRLQRLRRVQHGQSRRRKRGWLDEQAAALESLTAIRRAGASIILTYWAKDVARWLI